MLKSIISHIVWRMGGRKRVQDVEELAKFVGGEIYYVARWDWLDR